MVKSVDPDKILITSLQQLESELALLQTAFNLPETEHTWEIIDKALKRFHAVVRGGVCKSPFVVDFIKGLKLKAFVVGFVRSMATERTRLSGTTLDLLSSLTRLSSSFVALLPSYLPPLLRLLCRTNKLYISRTLSSLQSIIKNTKLPSILDYIVAEWRAEGGKSSSFRIGASELILTILGGGVGGSGETVVEKEGIEKKWLEELEWCIRTGATDKEVKVRAVIKSVWDVYSREWPERVAIFTGPLTPVTKKYLHITAAAPSGATSLSTWTSTSTSTARVPIRRPKVPSPLRPTESSSHSALSLSTGSHSTALQQRTAIIDYKGNPLSKSVGAPAHPSHPSASSSSTLSPPMPAIKSRSVSASSSITTGMRAGADRRPAGAVANEQQRNFLSKSTSSVPSRHAPSLPPPSQPAPAVSLSSASLASTSIAHPLYSLSSHSFVRAQPPLLPSSLSTSSLVSSSSAISPAPPSRSALSLSQGTGASGGFKPSAPLTATASRVLPPSRGAIEANGSAATAAALPAMARKASRVVVSTAAVSALGDGVSKSSSSASASSRIGSSSSSSSSTTTTTTTTVKSGSGLFRPKAANAFASATGRVPTAAARSAIAKGARSGSIPPSAGPPSATLASSSAARPRPDEASATAAPFSGDMARSTTKSTTTAPPRAIIPAVPSSISTIAIDLLGLATHAPPMMQEGSTVLDTTASSTKKTVEDAAGKDCVEAVGILLNLADGAADVVATAEKESKSAFDDLLGMTVPVEEQIEEVTSTTRATFSAVLIDLAPTPSPSVLHASPTAIAPHSPAAALDFVGDVEGVETSQAVDRREDIIEAQIDDINAHEAPLPDAVLVDTPRDDAALFPTAIAESSLEDLPSSSPVSLPLQFHPTSPPPPSIPSSTASNFSPIHASPSSPVPSPYSSSSIFEDLASLEPESFHTCSIIIDVLPLLDSDEADLPLGGIVRLPAAVLPLPLAVVAVDVMEVQQVAVEEDSVAQASSIDIPSITADSFTVSAPASVSAFKLVALEHDEVGEIVILPAVERVSSELDPMEELMVEAIAAPVHTEENAEPLVPRIDAVVEAEEEDDDEDDGDRTLEAIQLPFTKSPAHALLPRSHYFPSPSPIKSRIVDDGDAARRYDYDDEEGEMTRSFCVPLNDDSMLLDQQTAHYDFADESMLSLNDGNIGLDYDEDADEDDEDEIGIEFDEMAQTVIMATFRDHMPSLSPQATFDDDSHSKLRRGSRDQSVEIGGVSIIDEEEEERPQDDLTESTLGDISRTSSILEMPVSRVVKDEEVAEEQPVLRRSLRSRGKADEVVDSSSTGSGLTRQPSTGRNVLTEVQAS